MIPEPEPIGNKISLTDFLPENYQLQSRDPFSPLGALLAVGELFFLETTHRLDHIERNFDPLFSETPRLFEHIEKKVDPLSEPIKEIEGSQEILEGSDFLGWLATWVALDLDDQWSESKKRFMVGYAAELYRLRGTRAGLKMMIELFFDIQVEIHEWEWPQAMVLGRRSTVGCDTWLVGPIDLEHRFTVRWHPTDGPLNELDMLIGKIRTLIDREKPAHTSCYFEVFFPQANKREHLSGWQVGVTSAIAGFVLE